jgi:peptidoglycan hydrolase CwlO-like protein
MKKIFGIILLTLIITGALAFSLPTVRASAQEKLSYSACNKPVPYKLGTIDPRFELSNQQILSDIKTATSILSNAQGKNLFVYDEDAELEVNFNYDQRTALSTSINQLKSKLDTQNESLDKQIEKYYADLEDFKSRVADLNSTIEKHNSEGGAPPEIYEELVKRQDALKTESESLNERARGLKLSTNNYNSDVRDLNQDIRSLNSAISQKPEEGLYEPATQTITIFFATSRDELIHTLTHEFGHALGMQHVANPDSIMYSYSTPSLEITDEDSAELDYVCRKQFLPTIWAIRINQQVQFLFQSITRKMSLNMVLSTA